MDLEIKPCPFCGQKAEYDDNVTEHYGLDCPGVECKLCGVRNFADSKNDAIVMWNKRCDDDYGKGR